MSAAQRAAVVAQAMSWLGTPYHHHARIKGVGVDCAQLLCGVFEQCGLVPSIDTGKYPTDWHLHRNAEMFSAWLAQYAKPAAGEHGLGDVLLFRFGRTFSHGAIYVGDGLVVHSYIGQGVILSALADAPLAGREIQHWSFW